MTPYFVGGEAIICEGIVFFIDPEDPKRLYAASPSADTSDQRMDLIVAESIRILPLFAQDYPVAASILQSRTLVIRMVHRYAEKQSEFIRQVESSVSVDDLLSGQSNGIQ